MSESDVKSLARMLRDSDPEPCGWDDGAEPSYYVVFAQKILASDWLAARVAGAYERGIATGDRWVRGWDLPRVAAREAKLAQAMWDALGILGFDLDGNESPVGLTNLDAFIESFLRRIREEREDYDKACGEEADQ